MSFINEIIQSEWAHVKELRDKVAMYLVDRAAADNKAVEVLNNLIDDYYICLGQLEALPGEQAKAEPGQPKEEIKAAPEPAAEPITAAPINATAARPAIEKAISPDCAEPQAKIPLWATATNSNLANGDACLTSDAPSADSQIDMAPAVSEDDMWNCEFGDPVGPKLTDADLYED